MRARTARWGLATGTAAMVAACSSFGGSDVVVDGGASNDGSPNSSDAAVAEGGDEASGGLVVLLDKSFENAALSGCNLDNIPDVTATRIDGDAFAGNSFCRICVDAVGGFAGAILPPSAGTYSFELYMRVPTKILPDAASPRGYAAVKFFTGDNVTAGLVSSNPSITTAWTRVAATGKLSGAASGTFYVQPSPDDVGTCIDVDSIRVLYMP